VNRKLFFFDQLRLLYSNHSQLIFNQHYHVPKELVCANWLSRAVLCYLSVTRAGPYDKT